MTAVCDLLPLQTVAQQTRTGVLYRSTKLYDHNEGLSCCFSQWRADHSHCQQVHGYALAFRFVFVSVWLVVFFRCHDIGNLKEVRAWLHEMFDHAVLVATDDPQIGAFEHMAGLGLMSLRIVPSVGCEEVARFVFNQVGKMVKAATDGRVWVESVEVREHSGNSAIYQEYRHAEPPI